MSDRHASRDRWSIPQRGATFSLAAPLHRAVVEAYTAGPRSQPRHGARRGRSSPTRGPRATPSMPAGDARALGRTKRIRYAIVGQRVCQVPCLGHRRQRLHRFRASGSASTCSATNRIFIVEAMALPDRRGMPMGLNSDVARECRRADRGMTGMERVAVLQHGCRVSPDRAPARPRATAATRSSCSPAPITAPATPPFRG